MKKYLIAMLLLMALQTQAQQRFLMDTHNDALSRQLLSKVDLGKLQPTGNFDLVRAGQGGMSGQVFSVWCGEDYGKGTAFARANREIDSLYALMSRNPQMKFARNAAEVMKAYKQHKFVTMIGVEGGHMIEDRMDYIDSLAKRGMCYLTLTWNNSTSWATSARDEVLKGDTLPHKGLTDYGKQIVHHLNELGVMVDLSHVGETTFYDALAASSKPPIASHSSVYSLNPHRRNLKDAQLKALAQKGGVVFVNFYSGFIDTAYERKESHFVASHKIQLDSLKKIYGEDYSPDALNGIYKDEADAIRPPLRMLIGHIDYLVKLIGADHVGFGADFDGSESYPAGMDSVADYPKIAVELTKLGYTRKMIDQIFGGNFLRVLKANTGK